ncbi:MAG: hypothetical protein ACK41U_06120 [Paracoccus sp. (in: a-proteobacteria)]|uniref:hypothetical protein n=1 Tax=Paracoccus sp. TaxID=267 RepID=UPI00391A393A
MSGAGDSNRAQDAPRKPLAEIIVGSVAAAAVLVLMIYLAYQVVTGDEGPPDLEASVQSTRPLGAKTLMMVTVTNRGETTAAGVTVRAAIAGDEGRDISFDYVASGSSQTGAFLFDRPDVVAEDVRLTIHGFVEP